MRSFLRENLCSKSFPYFDRKFVERSDSGNKGDARRPGDSKIELFSDSLIRNVFYAMRKARRAFYMRFRLCCPRTQKSFGQRLGGECARSDSRLKITFRM